MISTKAVYDGNVILPETKLSISSNTEIIVYIEDIYQKETAKSNKNEWLDELKILRNKINVKGKKLSEIVIDNREERLF